MASSLIHVPQPASTMMIKQSPFFSSLPNALISEITEHFRLEEWDKSDYINQNVLISRFYLILDGQLEMKRSNPETGREVTLDMLYPGDSFDVITLLDGERHDVILDPVRHLKLMSIPIEMMRKWLWTYPELNKQFLPYLASKMRAQEDMTTNIALHDVTTRLSRIILKHINMIKTYTGVEKHEHEAHLITGLSDEALARMVGSVRQVINKQLQYWRSRGVLSKKRNEMIINDLDTLYKEAKYTQSSFKE